MPRFRHKPTEVEAIQYSWEDLTKFKEEAQDDVADFMGQNIVVVGDHIQIETPEGVLEASPGDWIIKGVNGEFYPCKPDVFEKSYELIEEETHYGEEKEKEVGV